jgi:hypothetical protein
MSDEERKAATEKEREERRASQIKSLENLRRENEAAAIAAVGSLVCVVICVDICLHVAELVSLPIFKRQKQNRKKKQHRSQCEERLIGRPPRSYDKKFES